MYGYDLNGNLTAKQTLPETDTYGYDALNRLTTQDTASGSFSYDPNGNRLSGDGTTYDYAPASNQLTQIGSTPVTLDAVGNTLSDGTRTFAYNDAGRLRQVTQSGTPQGTYLYNTVGLRHVKVTSQGTVTNYHYDGNGRLLEEFIRAGGQTYRRAYVWADDQPLAQIVRFPRSGTPEAVVSRMLLRRFLAAPWAELLSSLLQSQRRLRLWGHLQQHF